MRTLLVSAYGCEPTKGSEAGVGWNWVLQMAKHNKLYIITRANNQELIEQHLPTDERKENIVFYYYDTPDFIKNLKHKAKGLYFYYFCWQIGIISVIKKILRENKVDYTMHLTFGSMWMPTFLPYFRIPFIWGPIGGGDCEPKSFLKVLSLKQRILQSGRYLLNVTTFLNPLVVIPSLKAKCIICRTNNTLKAIPWFCRKKTIVQLETAMEDAIFQYEIKEREGNKLRFISTGRLMPSKNILTAIRALSYLSKDLDFEYVIVGSGPQKDKIKKEAIKLGIYEKIKIIDEVSRVEVLNLLTISDIFLFPSLREGGSWALMEAMAIGLPVVCLDWAGMQIITDDNCAIRLPVTTPEQMPIDMANAIVRLLENPLLRKQMSRAGRERIKNVFNWDAKGMFMEDLLNRLDRE